MPPLAAAACETRGQANAILVAVAARETGRGRPNVAPAGDVPCGRGPPHQAGMPLRRGAGP